MGILSKILIGSIELGNESLNFARWYPNLRHLVMYFVGFNTYAKQIPQLEHLSLSMYLMDENVKFLKVNSQLKYLDLSMRIQHRGETGI